jgi:hypothetical protein
MGFDYSLEHKPRIDIAYWTHFVQINDQSQNGCLQFIFSWIQIEMPFRHSFFHWTRRWVLTLCESFSLSRIVTEMCSIPRSYSITTYTTFSCQRWYIVGPTCARTTYYCNTRYIWPFCVELICKLLGHFRCNNFGDRKGRVFFVITCRRGHAVHRVFGVPSGNNPKPSQHGFSLSCTHLVMEWGCSYNLHSPLALTQLKSLFEDIQMLIGKNQTYRYCSKCACTHCPRDP